MRDRRSPARHDPSSPRRGTTAASHVAICSRHVDEPWARSARCDVSGASTRQEHGGRIHGEWTVGCSARAVMPRTRREPPPPPTLVLLVRHGQTPTTGTMLPGRAPGLHLADKGVEQARASCGTHRRAVQGRCDLRVAARAGTGDRCADRRRPRAASVQIDKGLLECDFGDWTGGELKKLMKLPEWRTVQRSPSTFTFPNGESFLAMQTRIVTALDRSARRTRVESSCACRTPIRSRPPSHTRSARTSTCSSGSSISTCSISAIAYTRREPDRPVRQLDRWLARRAATVVA